MPTPVKIKLLPRSTMKSKSAGMGFGSSVTEGAEITVTFGNAAYQVALTPFLQDGIGAVSRTYQNKVGETVSLTDFDAVGDGSTDNVTAYPSAVAASDRIYVPEGTFTAPTLGFADIADTYFHGPGKIKMASGSQWAPGRFSKFSNTPTPGGTAITSATLPEAWQGDLSLVEPEYYIIDPGVRQSLTHSYFEPTVTPHWIHLDNRGGDSGCICRLTAGIGPVAAHSPIAVTSTDGLTVGDTVAILDANGQVAETRTIFSLPTSTTLSFTANTTGTYATGEMIAKSLRTSQQIGFEQISSLGGGDVYARVYDINTAYVANAGQDHFFFRSTVGIDGGRVTASTDGVFLESREVQFHDNGNDITVVADIRNFDRTNDTAAYGGVYINTISNSEGAKACNAAHVVRGKWKAALDTGLADFGAENSAIRLADEHKISWGCTSTIDASGNGFWSDVLGSVFIRGTTAGTPEWGVFISGVQYLSVTAATTTVHDLTISNLGTGIAHLSSGGAVTSSLINLQADVTSILLPGNGGTGQNFSASSGILSFTAGTASLLTTIPLANGGTNAALTASNGGIFYSTASAGAILAGTATANLPLLSGSSTTPSWASVSHPTSATSGGVPYFSSSSVMATSALLASNQLVLGGGAGTAPATLGSAGTTTTVLHGNASGAPSFGAVSLTADVTGTLPVANGGTNASSQSTNGVAFFDGASLTTGSVLTFSGSQLSIVNTSGTPKLLINGSSGAGLGPLVQLQGNSSNVGIFGSAAAWLGSGTSQDFVIASFANDLLFGANGTEAFRVDSTSFRLKFQSSSVVANGSVATALSSVGPAGASTTVQEWLVVKNSAGTNRFIPMF